MKHLYLFAVLLFPLILSAQTYSGGIPGESWEAGGIKYKLLLESKEAIVDNGNSWTGDLYIPDKVDCNGQTYSVTGIGWLAFSKCKTLEKVRIPNTLHEIITVGVDPESNNNPFEGCTSLKAIEVDEANPSFCAIDGVLYDKSATILFCYPAGKSQQSFTIPEGVVRISGNSFGDNTALTSVEMPSSISIIDYGAFMGCSNLETINLPEGITHLSAMLFYNCSNLHEINIPQSVVSIGEQTFAGCSSLRVIDIPATVSAIGSLAFHGCSLQQLIIRGDIGNSLNRYLFSGLNESATIYVPAYDVERYKSVFNGTVLPLESYSTGINPKLRTGSNIPAYNLNGQRAASSHRGIIIKGGRKVLNGQ